MAAKPAPTLAASTQFDRAQQLARTPGSVVLARFNQERAAQRAALQTQTARPGGRRLFAGAQLGRLTDSWRATQRAINDELKGDIARLQARARELEANNDYAARYLNLLERHVVGHRGYRFKSLAENAPGKPDEQAQTAIEAGWAEFCTMGVCEVTGLYSFVDVCTSTIRGFGRDGEFLVREILGEAAGNRFGYALQILDVAQLATWLNRRPREGQNSIAMGVERNTLGRPVAYWFTEGEDLTQRKATRVPADTIIHRFRPIRPHQARGISGFHAAMLTLHYVGEFSISALLNAKAGSDRLGFFVSPDGQPPDLAADGLLQSTDGEEPGEHIATSAPGTYDTIPAGYDFKQVTNPYPNDVFGPFVKANTQRAATGLDVAYPTLGNDYESVNFSSLRGANLEDRDKWRQLQRWHIEALAERIFPRWLIFALANRALVTATGSALPIAKLDKYRPHTFRARGWAWVDPYKDAQADDIRLRQKLTTRTRLAAETGEDFEDLLAETRDEIKLAARYGIDLTAPSPAAPSKPDKPDGERPDEEQDQ